MRTKFSHVFLSAAVLIAASSWGLAGAAWAHAPADAAAPATGAPPAAAEPAAAGTDLPWQDARALADVLERVKHD
ncbi:MAG TPA: hypothetical protein VN692_23590, partial [Steroidobacteraceae bacterium]|nr:hypothetical protein [Steroidobacteraceae bacterium]